MVLQGKVAISASHADICLLRCWDRVGVVPA